MKKRQEAVERNHIEGKFGQEKKTDNLNQIRARLTVIHCESIINTSKKMKNV
jgi:hypothetical protein